MKTNTKIGALAAALLSIAYSADAVQLLNVSYDPTRELYAEINGAFAAHWRATKGEAIAIKQSHGGSGSQARAVIDGLEADVVTLALAYDIDAIADKTGALPEFWQKRLPHNSAPYTSTIVFVVRKGNPKGIRDWDDLVKPGVKVITPNPKTSGGARWNYLAAWAFAERKHGKDEKGAREFLAALFRNVPVLDRGARAATTTFAQRRIGDVFLSWENEAFLIEKEFPGQTQIVSPSISILAEPPVALIDRNANKKGTTEAAKAYLEFLYTPQAQKIIGKNFYRPRDASAAGEYASRFAKIEMVTIDDFGGWRAAQKKHFDDGGVFDEIYRPKK